MSNTINELISIRDAIACFDNKTDFAKAMGTSLQNLNQWELKGTFPAKHALAVERVTRGVVTVGQILRENELISSKEH